MIHINNSFFNNFLKIILFFNSYYICCLAQYNNMPSLPSIIFLFEQDMLIALKCYQPEFNFWSSRGLNNGNFNDKENRYYVRKGLIGDYTISLESSINRGFYWRVKGNNLSLEPNDGTYLFKEESSFIPVPGLEDFHLLSLRPVKYQRHYVRHYKDHIIISELSNKDVFLKDATWYVYFIPNN